MVKPVNGSYFWDYHDPTVPSHHVMHLQSVADVIDTFNHLVHALSWDIDPYRSIQVNVPAFPPIMVEMKDLPRALDDIRQLLLSALFNTPQTMTAEAAEEYMENDVEMDTCDCEDEDEDEDDEDEDEDDEDEEAETNDEANDADDEENIYADMPPLIPVNPSPPPVQSHSYFTRLQERLQSQQPSAAPAQGVHTYFS